jgi:translation initiation factor 2 subunit 2
MENPSSKEGEGALANGTKKAKKKKTAVPKEPENDMKSFKAIRVHNHGRGRVMNSVPDFETVDSASGNEAGAAPGKGKEGTAEAQPKGWTAEAEQPLEEPIERRAKKKKKKKVAPEDRDDMNNADKAAASSQDAKEAGAASSQDAKEAGADSDKKNIVKTDTETDDPTFAIDEKQKKKKKRPKRDDEPEEETWLDTDRDYTYAELLERVHSQLRVNNPNLAIKQTRSLPPPMILKKGTKKTLWANFERIAGLLQRTTEQLKTFVLAELSSTGSLDIYQRLTINGLFKPGQFESLLKKYIGEYVTCSMCRNMKTSLERDNVTRLFFLNCEICSSRRAVAPIKTGFHATNRADRRKVKEAK